MNKLMEFKPKVNRGYISYERDEGNGYYTIRISSPTTPVKVINQSFHQIMKFCNGSNSLLDIIKILHDKYSSVDMKIIQHDVISTVNKLLSLNIVENSDQLLSRPKKTTNISRVHNLNYCTSSDIKELREYYNRKEDNFKYYTNPLDNYSNIGFVLSNKLNVGNLVTYIFRVTRGQEIVGVISWKEVSENIVCLDYLKVTDDSLNLIKMILNSMSYIHTLSKESKTIYRVQLTSLDEINLFEKIGFNHKVVLEKELLGETDVIELSYYINYENK